ncbi:protein phosphatase CheZ [Siccirubricoccus phaeus]|uniref:protein phosphatase CheZ n=1 Tax=Siccirubricoccus phaeus TaxID=2595053 RepID=UPI001F358582|nr:protein phosphatase CheZ [Siccirubricoccus phaeus]
MLLETPSPAPDSLRAGLRAELLPMFEELRSFLDRRIQEVSAEVAATVQLMDFSEANLSGQLSKIHDQIVKLVAIPAANSRNSGLELEAVVQATEAAANTIMEAAEAIQDWISSGSHDTASLRALSDKVNSIFEACSFQDVTSQRIRRAIQHLQQVETMLESIVPAISATPAEQKLEVKAVLHTVSEAAQASADLDQDEIDRLLNG